MAGKVENSTVVYCRSMVVLSSRTSEMVRELLADKISKIPSVKGGRSEPMTRPKGFHRLFQLAGRLCGVQERCAA